MKKIAILGLHLGYGGVENAIVNEANMLCEDYDVELVITYKLYSRISYKLNQKVEVKFLTSLKPNREEFLNYLKNKQLFKAFIEGIKSINILIQKKKTMKDYIRHSDADILISSRIEITELLNKYAKNKITIAEEHRHHNNDEKYIKRLFKATKNINYLRCVSKELTEFYKKRIPHTNCVFIPNGLEYNKQNMSKLDNYNLISVGRLSKEKGYSDLILTFKLVNELDNRFHLNIIGDGIERKNIEALIESNNLTSKITLHGFQDKEYINKYLQQSSLYLMTSLEESFGIVLIEAASFGLPLMAFSSAQGAHEIITNDYNGYLIEDRNKEEMAKKIVSLVNDRNKLKEFGHNAKETANKYLFDNVKQIWLKFLKEVK